MKIIDILTYPVNLAGNHVFVKVLTDEHLYGIGEAYRVGPDEAVDQVIHYFKEWLIGQDPTRIEHLYRILYNGSRFPGGSMINAAISGIEIALWDLKGKAYGVPVYQLLGGRCRDRIRVYTGAGGGRTPKEIEDGLNDVIHKRGFTAIKTSPQPYQYQKLPWGRSCARRVQRWSCSAASWAKTLTSRWTRMLRFLNPFGHKSWPRWSSRSARCSTKSR